MVNSDRLSEAIAGVRNGDADSLENLYLLTYRDTYADIAASVEDEEYIWNIVRDTYIQVWKRSANMPEAGLIRAWIRILIKDVAKQKASIDINEFPEESIQIDERRIEEKAAAAIIRIEEQLGIFDVEEEPEQKKRFSVWVGLIFIFLLILLLSYMVFQVRNIPSELETEPHTASETVPEPSIVSEETQPEFGWQEFKSGIRYKKSDGKYMLEEWLEEDGKLYYFDDTGFMSLKPVSIDNQNFEFDSDGSLKSISRKYDMEKNDNILSREFEQLGFDKYKESIVDESTLQDGEWIYYLSKSAESISLPSLIRFKKGVGNMELISDNVGGYMLFGDYIWYSGDTGIAKFDKKEAGSAIGDEYTIGITDNRFSLYDSNGYLMQPSGEGRLRIGSRFFDISDGRVEGASPGIQRIGEYVFVLDREKAADKIFTDDGDEYLTAEGNIDAFCVIGDYLYYSSSDKESSSAKSRIYRYNVKTDEEDTVTDEFPGYVREMYYYSSDARVYMEYISPDRYEEIIFLNNEGSLFRPDISDTEEKHLNFGMEFIMADPEYIYAYVNVNGNEGEKEAVRISAAEGEKLADSAE